MNLRLLVASLLIASTLAAEPVLQPIGSDAPAATGTSSLVTGPDGTVYRTYAGPGLREGERALWLAQLAPDASTWSAPRAVVSTPLLMENWADFATLAVGTDGTLWAQWFQRPPGEDARGYDGWIARSVDGGANWSPPAPLGHEFVSLAPLSGGRVLAVWLASARSGDPAVARTKRDPHAPRPPKDPNAPYAPTMRLQACLLGPDGATLRDWVVDPDVCSCCQTTITRLSGDRVLVAYRGHTPDEIRDNSIALFADQAWSSPRLLHADGWKIPACPVNGPAADACDEHVAVAWFTAADGLARVQARQSRDGGAGFAPAVPIDLGKPSGRIDLVMLADGSSVISWMEASSSGVEAGLYVRRLFPDGKLSAPFLIATLSSIRATGFARLAARPGAGLPVVISWTEATPTDPANPKSPASTRVRAVQFTAVDLVPATASPIAVSTVRAVVRGDVLAFVDLCTVPSNH